MTKKQMDSDDAMLIEQLKIKTKEVTFRDPIIEKVCDQLEADPMWDTKSMV